MGPAIASCSCDRAIIAGTPKERNLRRLGCCLTRAWTRPGSLLIRVLQRPRPRQPVVGSICRSAEGGNVVDKIRRLGRPSQTDPEPTLAPKSPRAVGPAYLPRAQDERTL